ncbi:hypothetical protein HDU76_010897 [Blyttiomyces sp. JEL0837]|nr:hypothetical protein HDU76_010897 [Blyttiomyces sp. JEL0837]
MMMGSIGMNMYTTTDTDTNTNTPPHPMNDAQVPAASIRFDPSPSPGSFGSLAFTIPNDTGAATPESTQQQEQPDPPPFKRLDILIFIDSQNIAFPSKFKDAINSLNDEIRAANNTLRSNRHFEHYVNARIVVVGSLPAELHPFHNLENTTVIKVRGLEVQDVDYRISFEAMKLSRKWNTRYPKDDPRHSLRALRIVFIHGGDKGYKGCLENVYRELHMDPDIYSDEMSSKTNLIDLSDAVPNDDGLYYLNNGQISLEEWNTKHYNDNPDFVLDLLFPREKRCRVMCGLGRCKKMFYRDDLVQFHEDEITVDHIQAWEAKRIDAVKNVDGSEKSGDVIQSDTAMSDAAAVVEDASTSITDSSTPEYVTKERTCSNCRRPKHNCQRCPFRVCGNCLKPSSAGHLATMCQEPCGCGHRPEICPVRDFQGEEGVILRALKAGVVSDEDVKKATSKVTVICYDLENVWNMFPDFPKSYEALATKDSRCDHCKMVCPSRESLVTHQWWHLEKYRLPLKNETESHDGEPGFQDTSGKISLHHDKL